MAMDKKDVESIREIASSFALRYNWRTETLTMRPANREHSSFTTCGEHVPEDVGNALIAVWEAVETLCGDLLEAMPPEEE